METKQPTWKYLANLGDTHPIDHGGYFILEDTTGVYAPEAIYLESPDNDESKEPWAVYRFILEPHTYIGGILSDNPYHPAYAVWYQKDLKQLAESLDMTVEAFAGLFCSNNPIDRATAYREVLLYWGPNEFDSDPLTFKTRDEITTYLKDHVYGKAIEA